MAKPIAPIVFAEAYDEYAANKKRLRKIKATTIAGLPLSADDHGEHRRLVDTCREYEINAWKIVRAILGRDE